MSIEAMKLALEYLKDNQHLIADNERHAYVMEYNAFIERFEKAIEQAKKPILTFDGMTATEFWLLELYKFQEATKCDTADEFIEQAQKQEPVAWAQLSETGKLIDLLEEPCKGYVPLYATPPQRQPLTLEYIDQHIGADEGDREAVVALVREVEAAHGIKGEA